VAARPLPIASDRFTNLSDLWRESVLATHEKTFDSAVAASASGGELKITPRSGTAGERFGGLVSKNSYDLTAASIVIEVKQTSSETITIFAAGTDDANWIGFTISNSKLAYVLREAGRTSRKEVDFDSNRHRWLRLRTTAVGGKLVVWETSRDGKSWSLDYAATAEVPVAAVHVALSCGTNAPVTIAHPSSFGNFVVERRR
jgi:hypothetical protein